MGRYTQSTNVYTYLYTSLNKWYSINWELANIALEMYTNSKETRAFVEISTYELGQNKEITMVSPNEIDAEMD